MSDFDSSFWSWYVIAITVLGTIFCIVILMVGGRTRASASAGPENTTGHVWDGDLREINNPLPKWWVGLFWITILFSVGYYAWFPALGFFPGLGNWTSANQYEQEMAEANAKVEPLFAKFAALPAAEAAKNPEAMGIGQRLFLNNCAQCHGSDAGGALGFPNLTDNDWLYGGTQQDIVQSITNGRTGVMTPMGEVLGSPEAVKEVANYVLSLSGEAHDAAAAAAGKDKFAVCAACHGADAKGNQLIGAPNLTDNIWLHGQPTIEFVTQQIEHGKTNIMPAQNKLLTPDQIKVLASYVWSLSHQ